MTVTGPVTIPPLQSLCQHTTTAKQTAFQWFPLHSPPACVPFLEEKREDS